jgi:uncharacterized membrane protein
MNFFGKFITIAVLLLILIIVIKVLAGYYLWNHAVVQHFTFTRPSPSAWHFLGLILFSILIMPWNFSYTKDGNYYSFKNISGANRR